MPDILGYGRDLSAGATYSWRFPMRPAILVTTVPDRDVTRVHVRVYDLEALSPAQPVYSFEYESGRSPEDRPEWAAAYVQRILQGAGERLEVELDLGGPSLAVPGKPAQSSTSANSEDRAQF
jgi:hypothetical protein